MSYDPATVRAMLRQAYRRGHDDADEPAWNMHHKRCAEAGEAAINSILAAHPAPSTPAPSELHEHCVRMAMEAWTLTSAATVHWDDEERQYHRAKFAAAVRERLAQSAMVALLDHGALTQALGLVPTSDMDDILAAARRATDLREAVDALLEADASGDDTIIGVAMERLRGMGDGAPLDTPETDPSYRGRL